MMRLPSGAHINGNRPCPAHPWHPVKYCPEAKAATLAEQRLAVVQRLADTPLPQG